MPDDMSSFANVMPEAVRRQIARAEQLARDMGAQPEAGKPETETTTVGKTEEGFQQEPQETQTPQDQRGEPDAQPEPAPQPQPHNDWQQKYLTLQGKYSAEVRALNHQLRAQQQQIDNLQNMLASMQREPQPSTPAKTTSAKPSIAPEDVEAYGEDLVSAARRWARAEVAPELDQMRSRFAELEGRAQQTQVSVAQNAVERALDAEVSDWRTINTSPEFLGWLGETDPFSGQVRHAMLGDAYTAGNVPRTVAFFRAFQREHTAITPPAPSRRAHTPQGAGRPTLDQLAAPGRGNAGGDGGAQPERRTWSRDQITAFFRDKQRGAFDGREAEALRIEQDIFAAGSEGRVH